jgi:hypothetical protein
LSDGIAGKKVGLKIAAKKPDCSGLPAEVSIAGDFYPNTFVLKSNYNISSAKLSQ